MGQIKTQVTVDSPESLKLKAGFVGEADFQRLYGCFLKTQKFLFAQTHIVDAHYLACWVEDEPTQRLRSRCRR